MQRLEVVVILLSDKITYIIGSNSISVRPLVPYHDRVCQFLAHLSSGLRDNIQSKVYPDVLAFAFAFRQANILKLKRAFDNRCPRIGLGKIFHITPSNVPVNFAFSFVFGVLSGNANVVRLPSKSFAQVDIICSTIKQLFSENQYREIRDMTAFVQYKQNDEITAEFSSSCNVRIVWGGDDTIRNIRKIPIPEKSTEITFPDRHSLCIINSLSVIELDDIGLNRLAEGFYRDTYLMDQNACSSPHLVVWLGTDNEIAKGKFWEAVCRVAIDKYDFGPMKAVDKYARLCQDAIGLNNISVDRKYKNLLYCVQLKNLSEHMHDLRGKYGYFYEYDADDISFLKGIVNSKYQTLTYFGVNKSELINFVIENGLLGIDRIVPIGHALDIGVIWDGYDLVTSLSRIIDVR